MKKGLPPAETSALREYYPTLSTRKLAEEANSDYRHLKDVMEVLETERQNGNQYGISIALSEVCRQEEKLKLIGEELRTRSDYNREKMLDF